MIFVLCVFHQYIERGVKRTLDRIVWTQPNPWPDIRMTTSVYVYGQLEVLQNANNIEQLLPQHSHKKRLNDYESVMGN